jgi:hypothetical protein
MTVTYESLRLNRIGSLCPLTLTHEVGSNADADSSRAVHGNPARAIG